MGSKILLLMSMLIILGCQSAEKDTESPYEEVNDFASQTWSDAELLDVKSNLDIYAEYLITETNPQVKRNLVNRVFQSTSRGVTKLQQKSHNIEVHVYDNVMGEKREIMTLMYGAQTNGELERTDLPDYILEQKLKTKNNGLSYVILEESTDEELNSTRFDLNLGIEKSELKQNIMFTKRSFEDFTSRVIQRIFTEYSRVTELNIGLYSSEIDNRTSENITLIANYSINRDEYNEINKNWDKLVIKIYDDIIYTPIFLMDFVAESEIEALEYGDSTTLYLYYPEAYEDFITTREVLYGDARNIIEYMFSKYDKVNTITVIFKAKIPATGASVDGHQIIHDFVTISANSGDFDNLVAENLDNNQYMFNFDAVWHSSGLQLSISENLFESFDEYTFREISFDNNNKDATIIIDSCHLLNSEIRDYNKIIDVYQKLQAEEETKTSLEEEVANAFYKVSRNTIYKIHPPFLETVVFGFERVHRDTTGNEIDVLDMGSISFEMQEGAFYWFQTLDSDELVWVEELDDDLDIDDDDDLCQN